MPVHPDRPPYSCWVKCVHTCKHTIDLKASRPKPFARITYQQGNKRLVAGDLIPIYRKKESRSKVHAINKKAHATCTPDCPGHWLLGQKQVHVRACDTRAELTRRDWEEYGVGLAILQAGNKGIKFIPKEYFQRAQPYLARQLRAADYAKVLQERGIEAEEEESEGSGGGVKKEEGKEIDQYGGKNHNDDQQEEYDRSMDAEHEGEETTPEAESNQHDGFQEAHRRNGLKNAQDPDAADYDEREHSDGFQEASGEEDGVDRERMAREAEENVGYDYEETHSANGLEDAQNTDGSDRDDPECQYEGLFQEPDGDEDDGFEREVDREWQERERDLETDEDNETADRRRSLCGDYLSRYSRLSKRRRVCVSTSDARVPAVRHHPSAARSTSTVVSLRFEWSVPACLALSLHQGSGIIYIPGSCAARPIAEATGNRPSPTQQCPPDT
ncbi:hypothetical protein LshimejAT787_2100050 [Lyophyllum shimeji]|uniref:Uncharacterized protein n=1 Tax=Lyophyllum shimeji TaxID=47721 RepID=A0A9P3Q092_LYOSH|nr:hypothetical protein LshimejAT787_2100050 [Lyophyllum shimeji]